MKSLFSISLTVFQKNDPFPAKEIAIIALTRIYVLLHEYQALVREIATPTLSAFVTACLQIIKPPVSSKSGQPPVQLIDTIANALCTITPLYPTTLRPFSAQVKAAFRTYVAPTATDKTIVPETLREASRRLFVLQHYTTPKNGNAQEWGKAVTGLITTSHATADQVFRAVQESWEASSGYVRQGISYEDDPHGGSDSAESFPPWNGLSSGADRLVGLLGTLAAFFKSPSKIPVTIPVSTIVDLTARITMIVPPQRGSKSQDGTQLNAAIGREEKDELWSVLPDIHVAVMDLLLALLQRLQETAVTIAADILHQIVRIFDANQQVCLVREQGYVLVRNLLILHGPTMPKISVSSLDKTIQFCCRDLLAASGHAGSSRASLNDPRTQSAKASSSKPSSNADAYLTVQTKSSVISATDLPATHIEAASVLLEVFLSHLPQQHMKQTLRALIDRTAVLSHNKGAMVASVLNPYRMRTGKMLASVFPFLARDFPREREVEVLRSNLRTGTSAAVGAAEDGDDEVVLERMQKANGEENEEELEETEELDREEVEGGEGSDEEMGDAEVPKAGFDLASLAQPANEYTAVVVEKDNASGRVSGETKQTVMLSTTLKHRSEELMEPPAKRLDTGKAPEIIGGRVDVVENGDGNDDDDSDSDASVHLNATLEDDDDSEDEE